MTCQNQYIMPPLQQSNFHRQLSSNFGRRALNLFRKTERKTIALAKWKNHLHFNLSCKRQSIFPPSLSLTCPIKGARADAILHRAKKALLRERIRQTSNNIKNIQKDILESKANFITAVDAETSSEAERLFSHAEKNSYDR